MNKDNLKKILDDHKKWMNNECGGINANLRGADLCDANPRGANLRGADLCGAKPDNINDILISYTSICSEGDIIGWKKCQNNIIVKLRIPADARRSNATGRKCRAEFADVLEIFGGSEGVSKYDDKVKYVAGQRVTCHEWDTNRREECSGGIHFFITRLEAENYD